MMETILLNTEFTNQITFTLLHSLWQGFIIFAGIKLILLFVPELRSQRRYAVAIAGLLAFLLATIMTFALLVPETRIATSADPWNTLYPVRNEPGHASLSFLHIAKSFIVKHSHIVTFAWIAGAFLFLVRLSGSLWYIKKILQRSTTITHGCKSLFESLRKKLEIHQTIALLESQLVHAPLVTGVLKPAIILPIGLTTGLSTEQIESIFLHELFHIKRNDYLLNMVQSVLESLFFFNPFVWLINAVIRKEREHCCDDAVVKLGVDKKSYVYALTSLEEARLQKTGIALSFAEDKYALLTRIKRLMEKSAHHYSFREKMLPVLLLLIGFICASWFTIQPSHRSELVVNTFAGDTIIKQKKSKPGKQGNNKLKEDQRRDPESERAFEADGAGEASEDEFDFSFDLNIPDVPAFDFPEIPSFDFTPPDFPEFSFDQEMFENLPQPHDWSRFQEEFNKEFSERFGDFYREHRGEIEQMMRELREKNGEWMERGQLEQIKAMALAEKSVALQKEFLQKHEHELKAFEKHIHQWEEENSEHMKQLESQMKEVQKKMSAFQKELTEQLLKDGYFNSSESAKQIHWDDRGVLTINGKTISEKDSEKYRLLHQKYFDKQNRDVQRSE